MTTCIVIIGLVGSWFSTGTREEGLIANTVGGQAGGRNMHFLFLVDGAPITCLGLPLTRSHQNSQLPMNGRQTGRLTLFKNYYYLLHFPAHLFGGLVLSFFLDLASSILRAQSRAGAHSACTIQV